MKHVIYSGIMNSLNIERSTRDSKYNMTKHWHPECELQYFISGNRKFFIDNQIYTAKAGSLFIVDAEQIHSTFSDKALAHDRILVQYDKQFFYESAIHLGIDLNLFFNDFRGMIQVPSADRPYVQGLLHGIANEVINKELKYVASVQIKFLELVIYLERLKVTGGRDFYRINPILRPMKLLMKLNNISKQTPLMWEPWKILPVISALTKVI
ncbi:AraC family ligand binding domain-containing protein [Lapidilactobacillus bayanensis]|uniref:AraC family ligand binding domain-containing protein n=1 Tax=Lapidilactobacillus bayanensis TaxID=2485998 RepID=UPI001CDB92FE|nr:AraC family ligand binding domain-containing protein [Lapidilactobacillus bayanensis]